MKQQVTTSPTGEQGLVLTILRKTVGQGITKHCEQLKRAALKIPWAGSFSSGYIGCLTIYAEKNNTHSKNTARNLFLLIRLNLIFCELLFLFLFFHFEGEIFYLPFGSCLDLLWYMSTGNA